MGQQPLPISTSSASNSCGEIISSNCVSWAGAAIPGVCKGASVTDVITAVQNNSTANSCCTGDFTNPNVSGYTGKWVDFSAGIPASGGLPGSYTWNINQMGTPFGYVVGGPGTGPENNPSYMWTPQGDLKLRGSFLFSINPLIAEGGVVPPIALAGIPTINFPTGFTASQSVIVGTTGSYGFSANGGVKQVTRAFLTIDYPSGILYLNYAFVDTTKTNITEGIFLGGVTFNLS